MGHQGEGAELQSLDITSRRLGLASLGRGEQSVGRGCGEVEHLLCLSVMMRHASFASREESGRFVEEGEIGPWRWAGPSQHVASPLCC